MLPVCRNAYLREGKENTPERTTMGREWDAAQNNAVHFEGLYPDKETSE